MKLQRRIVKEIWGQRRQIALYLEEIDNFKPIYPGNSKDRKVYADLLDVTIVNLTSQRN